MVNLEHDEYAKCYPPGTELAPVVECKFCRHYDSLNHQCYFWDSRRVSVHDENFCSFGTKREVVSE